MEIKSILSTPPLNLFSIEVSTFGIGYKMWEHPENPMGLKFIIHATIQNIMNISDKLMINIKIKSNCSEE